MNFWKMDMKTHNSFLWELLFNLRFEKCQRDPQTEGRYVHKMVKTLLEQTDKMHFALNSNIKDDSAF